MKISSETFRLSLWLIGTVAFLLIHTGRYSGEVKFLQEEELLGVEEPHKKEAESHGSQRPPTLLFLGERYFDIGKYDLAIQTFNQLLREYGEGLEREIRREAMLYLGKCFEHKLDYLSAIEYYSLLLKELSSKETLYQSTKVRVGYCYLQLGKYEKAIQTWEELLREMPETSEWRIPVSRVLFSYRDVIRPFSFSPLVRKNNVLSRITGPINQCMEEFRNDFLKDQVVVIYGRKSNNIEENSASAIAAYMYAKFIGKRLGKDSPLPCKEDKEVSFQELKNKNLVIFGSPRTSRLLESITAYLPIKIRADRIEVADRVYRGNDLGVIMLAPNPYNEEKFVLLYIALDPFLLRGIQSVDHGPSDYVIFSHKALKDDEAILEEGYFYKVSPKEWIPYPSSKVVETR